MKKIEKGKWIDRWMDGWMDGGWTDCKKWDFRNRTSQIPANV